MKNLIKHLFLLTLIPGLALASNNKVAFLKEKLIITPKEQAATKANIIKKLLPALIVPNLFDFFCLKLMNKHAKRLIYDVYETIKTAPQVQTPDWQHFLVRVKMFIDNHVVTLTDNLPFIFSVGLPSILFYYIAHKIIFNQIQKANFIKFIKEWELNKNYTPKECCYLFEQLHLEYKNHQRLDPKKLNELTTKVNLLINQKAKG